MAIIDVNRHPGQRWVAGEWCRWSCDLTVQVRAGAQTRHEAIRAAIRKAEESLSQEVVVPKKRGNVLRGAE